MFYVVLIFVEFIICLIKHRTHFHEDGYRSYHFAYGYIWLWLQPFVKVGSQYTFRKVPNPKLHYFKERLQCSSVRFELEVKKRISRSHTICATWAIGPFGIYTVPNCYFGVLFSWLLGREGDQDLTTSVYALIQILDHSV